MTEDGDSIRPSIDEICNRLIALTALVWRAEEERLRPPRWQFWRRSAPSAAFLEWAAEAKPELAYSPRERSLAEQPFGSWDASTIFEVSWRKESLVGLLWSIGALPSARITALPTTTDAVLSTARRAIYRKALWTLRDTADVERLRDAAEAWNWRARTHLWGIERIGAPITRAAETSKRDGLLEEIVSGDFALDGVPYPLIEQRRKAELISVTMERHVILNWLCGYASENEWDETPTDT